MDLKRPGQKKPYQDRDIKEASSLIPPSVYSLSLVPMDGRQVVAQLDHERKQL